MSGDDEGASAQGRALKGTALALAAAAFLWSILEIFLAPVTPPADPVPQASPVAKFRTVAKRRVEPPPARYREVGSEVGVRWRSVNGARGEKRFPESMGTGVAWIDWDNDNDPDLVFTNAMPWADDPQGTQEYSVAAFENDGTGQFTDKTKELGLDFTLYGTGIAAGDVNGDGFTDLFFSALGKNRLMLNRNGTRFEDATSTYGVAGLESDYSTCAAFFDADGDGDLDLIVGGYSRWSKDIDASVRPTIPGFGVTYADPDVFEGQSGRAFRNENGSRFTEVQSAWGLASIDPTTSKMIGKNLGFAFDYFNDDRRLDVVVANDRVENLFLLSEPEGYRNVARDAGLAFERRGKPSAAMGIDIDFDPDANVFRIIMGNFFDEMTSVYVGTTQNTTFLDETIAEGVGPRTNNRVTFGALFVDYDLDGRRDIIEVNGAIDEVPKELLSVGTTYRQPADVFWNCGGACRTQYLYVGRENMGDIGAPFVGRGLAAADMDGDGDLDLAATGIDESALVFRNDRQNQNHWVRVKLVGKAPNTEAIGAEVYVRHNNSTQRRLVQPAASYLSHNELIQTFGLGQELKQIDVRVVWPNGLSTAWQTATANQLLVVREAGVP